MMTVKSATVSPNKMAAIFLLLKQNGMAQDLWLLFNLTISF
jgi:hypothetical protein